MKITRAIARQIMALSKRPGLDSLENVALGVAAFHGVIDAFGVLYVVRKTWKGVLSYARTYRKDETL